MLGTVVIARVSASSAQSVEVPSKDPVGVVIAHSLMQPCNWADENCGRLLALVSPRPPPPEPSDIRSEEDHETSRRNRGVGAGYDYQWDVALHFLLRFVVHDLTLWSNSGRRTSDPDQGVRRGCHQKAMASEHRKFVAFMAAYQVLWREVARRSYLDGGTTLTSQQLRDELRRLLGLSLRSPGQVDNPKPLRANSPSAKPLRASRAARTKRFRANSPRRKPLRAYRARTRTRQMSTVRCRRLIGKAVLRGVALLRRECGRILFG
jgi:hypothetical protein